MENSAQSGLEEMEWEELFSLLQAPLNLPPPPPPPAPPLQSAVFRYNTHVQPVGYQSGGCGGSLLLGAAPQWFGQPSLMTAAPNMFYGPLSHQYVMQPAHLYYQPGVYNQAQYQQYQWPVHDGQVAAAFSYPAAPPQLNNNFPAVMLPAAANIQPVGVLHGRVLYGNPAPFNFAAPPPNTFESRRRNEERDEPYIKKPPNAFMLFLKDQRSNVVAELNIRDSAVVSTILGQRWRLLSDREKSRYFYQAKAEKQLHAQRHPNWSSRHNYGRNRKGKSSTRAPAIKASAYNIEEDTPQANLSAVTEAEEAPCYVQPPEAPDLGSASSPDSTSALDTWTSSL